MKKEQRKIAIRLTVVLALVVMLGCDRFSSNTETLETASVTIAPAVPPPIARTKPAHGLRLRFDSERIPFLTPPPSSNIQRLSRA